jgi:hypothetical protein
MSLTASDVIIITVATILTLLTIILVIWEAEKQMYEYGLRPSESTSTDIAGLMTLAGGLTGNVENIKYGNITNNIIYDIAIKNKIVCVKSVSRYSSTDCSSSVLNAPTLLTIENATSFTFEINKDEFGQFNLLLTKNSGV